MASRSIRRREHKKLRHMLTVQARHRLAVANQLLIDLQAEARRRANWLGSPPAWRLTTDPHIQTAIRELDPTGNLLADLQRVCAEAIAEVVDRRMIDSCRPLIARTR